MALSLFFHQNLFKNIMEHELESWAKEKNSFRYLYLLFIIIITIIIHRFFTVALFIQEYSYADTMTKENA